MAKMLAKIPEIRERAICEQATGCIQVNQLGSLYDDHGHKLTNTKARKLLRAGETVEVPNAGAGSFRSVLYDVCGCTQVHTVNTTSSAGDWQFAVMLNGLWHIAQQDNRYPKCGMKYTIQVGIQYESLVQLEAVMNGG